MTFGGSLCYYFVQDTPHRAVEPTVGKRNTLMWVVQRLEGTKRVCNGTAAVGRTTDVHGGQSTNSMFVCGVVGVDRVHYAWKALSFFFLVRPYYCPWLSPLDHWGTKVRVYGMPPNSSDTHFVTAMPILPDVMPADDPVSSLNKDDHCVCRSLLQWSRISIRPKIDYATCQVIFN